MGNFLTILGRILEKDVVQKGGKSFLLLKVKVVNENKPSEFKIYSCLFDEKLMNKDKQNFYLKQLTINQIVLVQGTPLAKLSSDKDSKDGVSQGVMATAWPFSEGYERLSLIGNVGFVEVFKDGVKGPFIKFGIVISIHVPNGEPKKVYYRCYYNSTNIERLLKLEKLLTKGKKIQVNGVPQHTSDLNGNKESVLSLGIVLRELPLVLDEKSK